MKQPVKSRSKAFQGNALLEYVVPASMLILGFAVISQIVNIQDIMGSFYAKANGDAKPSGTYAVTAMAQKAQGVTGTGIYGFGNSLQPSLASQLLGMTTASTPPPPITSNGTSMALNAACYASDNCVSGQQQMKSSLSAVLTGGQQATATQDAATQAQIDALVAQRNTLMQQLATEAAAATTTTTTPPVVP